MNKFLFLHKNLVNFQSDLEKKNSTKSDIQIIFSLFIETDLCVFKIYIYIFKMSGTLLVPCQKQTDLGLYIYYNFKPNRNQ